MNTANQDKKAMNKVIAPYGLWSSSCSIEQQTNQTSPPYYPFQHNKNLYWLASRPNESGRIALMTRLSEQVSHCITPQNYNIRTAVHEYGGCCFCPVGDDVVFNNYKDGNLYRHVLYSPQTVYQITQHSENSSHIGYADLICSPNKQFVIAIAEERCVSSQNINKIVAINLQSGDQTVLASGADFYANPVLSEDGNQLAWFEWSHPFMPWDQSRLMLAQVEIEQSRFQVVAQKTILDEPNCAVCQLGFLTNGDLIFVSDSDGCDYWSFFQYHDAQIKQITHCSGEFGEAHWVFGQRRWQAVDNEMLVAVLTTAQGDEIIEIDCVSGNTSLLHQGFAACSHLAKRVDDGILFVSHYSDRASEISKINLYSGVLSSVYVEPVKTDHNTFSQPIAIEFPTDHGNIAHGWFYPPCNPNYSAPADTLPPLIVTIHGGPTGRANNALNHLKQYFCALGYAVLDINHRGSTGFGRNYRQSLLGQWGEFDAMDIKRGIEFAVKNNWINGDLVFIRGSSAGGYAVLRALTQFPDLFCAGACYYGIGNLITLCQVTHKFESHYTDRLVGEVFDANTAERPGSVFITRSPVFHLDNLNCPLILFQGEDDKVVPAEVSREVVALLQRKMIKHSYTEYAGEGHGFRQASTKIDSLKRETEFFSEIIRSKTESTIETLQ